MIKLIFIIILVFIATILVMASLKPRTFRVMRSAIIPATPDKVFAFINELHHWKSWSAWGKKDLNMQTSYSGPPGGKGAIYEWSGNKNVGSGRMEIIESIAPTLVVINLDFITPFEGHNKTSFALQAVSEGTKVVWVMDGPMAFIPKVFSVFVDMDKMIGKDFEESLESLKSVACK
jgi:hypothetical protein